MAGLKTTLSRISLGVVLVLAWAWMFVGAESLFPINPEPFKENVQTYIIFTTLIFGFALAGRKVKRPLFEVSFIKAFPKFLLFAGITLAILFLFGLTIAGDSLKSVSEALVSVSFGVILLQALVVSIAEEKIFRGWLPEELKSRGVGRSSKRGYSTEIWIITALIFAVFHWFVVQEWTALLLYIPLAMGFMWVKVNYSPKTDMANAGTHFGWNMFVLGFLV